jgi:hypothetical protein
MPRHLDELTVHRFRGLRDVSLTDLRGVNLFVGTNDSGKTSLLEALSLFVQPLDMKAWLDASRRRDVGLLSAPSSALLDWLFPHAARAPNGVAQCSISGRGAAVAVQLSKATFAEITRAGLSGEKDFGAKIELSVLLTSGTTHSGSFSVWDGEAVDLREPKLAGLNVQTVTPVSHRVEQLQAQQLSEATIEGYKIQVLNLARKIDPEIRNIEILSPRLQPVIYLEHAQAGTAPVAVFGDGVRRALSLALTLPQAAGGVLLIDEIEASIHVSALGPLFKWLVEGCAEFNVQLFATTHSLEAVDAILESNGDESDLAAFRLRSDASGITCKRLSGDLLHRLRYERGLDVRV